MTDLASPTPRVAGPTRPLALLARIGAAVLGGYAFCWGFVAIALSGLYAAGMPFHDAEHLAAILAVLLYLVIFCWTFAARRVGLVWAVLLVGGGVMSGVAQLTQRALLA
ncbi:iron uptake protein [Roseateles sp. MS654]|uniref:iron uptake protein n=1 Tax=Roseateles sp. MS654 TaxID=3412685 RepID=UPI003C2D25ED